MSNKVCFKCGELKELPLFYKHKMMSDGHLNKCIECTKNDSDKREKKLRNNLDWVEKEKIRAREKYYRLGYKDIHKPTQIEKKKAISNYNIKYPEKKFSRMKMAKKIKAKPGHNLHHWSYNKEHCLDVIELNVLEHNKLHRYIIYDQERLMYRRCDNNELLDTKENHIQFYNSLINLP